MSLPERCDVVVIGGGPAGSMTAAYLARAGYEVHLLEKQKHPRNTVGESLIPDFWKYCDEAKVTAKLEAEGFLRKAGGTVDWHGATSRLAFKDFGYTRPALHVERDRFDFILLEHAREVGAHVHEEVAVQNVEFYEGGAWVHYRPVEGKPAAGRPRIACRFVVDASGQNSVLARQLQLRVIDEDFRFMSVWGYFYDSKYIAPDGEMHAAAEVATLPPTTYVSSVPGTGAWGWSWHIMLRKWTSVGLVLPVDAARDVKGTDAWERYLLQKCESMPRLKALLEGARLAPDSVSVIRDYSYSAKQVAGPGYFLVGDAAGFVDPIFSVGVVLSFYSAQAAAWAIDRSLRAPARTAQNQAVYENQLQSRMQLSRALALPKYEAGSSATLAARQAMEFADANAQKLIRAASALTARSEHFHALVDQPAASTTGGRQPS
jgi:flavin-dependent dehydrogenase